MWAFDPPFPKCESSDRWRFKRQFRDSVGTLRAVAGDHEAAVGAVEQAGRASKNAV